VGAAEATAEPEATVEEATADDEAKEDEGASAEEDAMLELETIGLAEWKRERAQVPPRDMEEGRTVQLTTSYRGRVEKEDRRTADLRRISSALAVAARLGKSLASTVDQSRSALALGRVG
jgi:hypothetical protein